MVYLIGSLKNPKVPEVAQAIRQVTGLEVFDQWYGAGPNADDCWQAYCKLKGMNYKEALADYGAQHVYHFDRKYLTASDTVVLVLPAGKSGHLELGWALGQGKAGYILLDGEPERYDVMYNFATGIFFSLEELTQELKKSSSKPQ